MALELCNPVHTLPACLPAIQAYLLLKLVLIGLQAMVYELMNIHVPWATNIVGVHVSKNSQEAQILQLFGCFNTAIIIINYY